MAETQPFLFWTDADQISQRTPIGRQPVTVGSGSMCGIPLPASQAATVHALVEREHDQYVARRLSRTQDLRVNGEATEARQLVHGDRIVLGDAEVVYLEPIEVAPATLRLAIRREDEEDTTEVEIAKARTIIGRSEGDILLDDASVSRHHLEIENFGVGLRFVRDLESTNGSELNGEPLTDRRHFEPGDVLKAGRIEIRVEEGGEPPEGVTDFPQKHIQFDQDSAPA